MLGVWTALVSPFCSGGRFDTAAFARLLNFQKNAGVAGVVPGGTTGEAPTLTWEEQGAMVAACVRFSGGTYEVMAGVGSNCTEEAVDATRDAWARGAQHALLVDCYYNGPSSLELRREYYERVIAAVPEITIVPYVVPARTGCALSGADLAILHQRFPDRVRATKSASGDLERMKEERQLCGPALSILSGDDELTFDVMANREIRASGVVSVLSNLVPHALVRMCQAALDGRFDVARQVQAQIAPLLQLVSVHEESVRLLPDGRQVAVKERYRNPVPIKTMMAGLGMIPAHFRAPLGPMPRVAVELCRQALRRVHSETPALLKPLEAQFEISVVEALENDRRWESLCASGN